MFFRNQVEKMFCAQGVRLAKDVAYPLKEKRDESKALNETMLPMMIKKSIIISHTQHKTTPILTLISTKEKEWGHEKKMRPTSRARKNKQREKTLKESKLIKVN